MKKMKLAVLLVLVATMMWTASAQTPGKPAVAQPTAEQKARLTELAKAWDQKVLEAEAARDKYLIALGFTLAELGLKPSETSVSRNEKGEPVFGRVDAAKVAPKEKP